MGTIKTTNIEPIADNGTVTLGSSGDTFTVPSGVTVNMSSATQTGVGGANTPAFSVYLNANQSISNNTLTKVTFDTEEYDSDNAFASNKFTVPSGEGGKYLLSYIITIDGAQNSNTDSTYLKLLKNGSTTIDEPGWDFKTNPIRFHSYGGSKIVTLSAGDYVEVHAYHSASISDVGVIIRGGSNRSYFCGLKIIE